MEDELAKLMCKMKQQLSPNFFDIQPHLTLHLVRKVEFARPASYRWMYYLEGYMKNLKRWVRQKTRPKDSMAERYIL